MSELVESDLPGIEIVSFGDEHGPNEEAPWGYKADGTPKKRPGRTPGSGGGGGTRTARLANLEGLLKEQLIENIAPPVGVFSPLMAAVIDERAERVSKALCTLAETSPGFRKGLEKIVKWGALGELVMFPLALVTAGAVEFGWMAPGSFAAQRFHVSEHWVRLYGDDGTENLGGSNNGYVTPTVEPRSTWN